MKEVEIEFLHKLNKDLINFDEITKDEIRFLVDTYMRLQKERLRQSSQHRSLEKLNISAIFHSWLGENFYKLEKNIHNLLLGWCKTSPLAKRLLSVCGIGPVIASGLLAHIDFKKALSAASVWRFAGLDPTVKWEKGKKKPFNGSLKLICYYAGESFVKQQNNDNDFYGKIYKQRRAYEEAKNAKGDYEEQAKKGAARVGKATEAYKYYSQGKLPPAHLYQRACRYTVKILLSHLHEVGFQLEFGKQPPFYFEKLESHTHKIEVPF